MNTLEAPLPETLDIERLEGAMLKLEQAEVPVVHRFAPGMYWREMHAKAGLWIVSHEHRTEHLNVLLKGRISVLVGGEVRHLSAPAVLTSRPGERKVGLVWEDCIWATAHPTEETDLLKLEELLIRKSKTYQLHEYEMARLMEGAS